MSVLLPLNEHLPFGRDDGGCVQTTINGALKPSVTIYTVGMRTDFMFPLLQEVLRVKQSLGEPNEDLGPV